jgi:4-aminobutyrate aminotransferase-like enzyme
MGLMLGAELVKNGQEPAVEEADQVLELMKNQGVLIGKNGRYRNVLAFQPPLVITRDDAEEMLRQLDAALTRVER